MRHLVFAACVTLAACSPASTGNRTADPADVNAAAAEAQDDIDRYAADATPPARPQAVPSAIAVTPAPAEPPVAAVTDDDPARVVRDYFDAIAAGRHADAWRLWDDVGRASGMSPRQFADDFARYASYRAEVGPPGRVDAGAGQRYVEVPVRVAGTLVEGGRPFALRGTLVLHRTADIDGATAEQRRWRISASTLRPQPAATATAPTAD